MGCLYIGLGGAGIETVRAIYERKLQEGDSCVKERYLLIDTDVHSRGELPSLLQRAFIEIGSKSPSQIKEEALHSPQKDWFLSWYDYYDCNHSLCDGTGKVRSYGRLALLSKYDDIYHRMSSVLCELESGLASEELLHVIVATGSCGGTGSAIMLDVLYMLRTVMLSGAIHDIERCNCISLLVAMPQLWISMAGKNDPAFEYKLTANAIAFFTELQYAIDSSDVTPSPYYPLVPPAEKMKDLPFVPFSCCCVFESNRMTIDQVSRNMAEIACAISRVSDSDIYWGLAKSMSVVSYQHLQEEFLSVASLRRCAEIVNMDLDVGCLKKEKVCYLVRPELHIPVEVLNLGNENVFEFRVKGQIGVDVLSFHTFSVTDYAFYKQYRALSDGRWAYVDKKFAGKVLYSFLE